MDRGVRRYRLHTGFAILFPQLVPGYSRISGLITFLSAKVVTGNRLQLPEWRSHPVVLQLPGTLGEMETSSFLTGTGVLSPRVLTLTS